VRPVLFGRRYPILMAPKKASGAEKPRHVWVVLLCGLPGSGKSTLRGLLVREGWIYVSQDEMGTSEACEKALLRALRSGHSCLVDRCNVTSGERRLWMQHATRALDKGLVKNTVLHFEAVWMATSPEICKQRAITREKHATLSPETASNVIDRFCRGLSVPERSGREPYEAVHFVANELDTAAVVQRYADPKAVDATVRPSSTSKAAVAAASSSAVSSSASAYAPEDAKDEDNAKDALEDGEEARDDVEAACSSTNDDDQSPAEDDAVEAVPVPAARPAVEARANKLAELFVLRHGERADRAKGRDDGFPDDPALTKEGRETAKRAGVALRSLAASPWAVVYCSPFFRCLQTANEIAAELGLATVRIEPGLSELCTDKIFDQEPRLRPASDALAKIHRVEVDLSEAPLGKGTLPQWPEHPRDANARALGTAKALAARHPGQAICLVTHSHSLVEITRHLPTEGGGAASSTAGYCALTRISHRGVLQRCLDLSYLKAADQSDTPAPARAALPEYAATQGSWTDSWQWSDGRECDPIDELLEMSLEEALQQFPRFRAIFNRGSQDQRDAWHHGWASGSVEVRAKLEKVFANGIFEQAD